MPNHQPEDTCIYVQAAATCEPPAAAGGGGGARGTASGGGARGPAVALARSCATDPHIGSSRSVGDWAVGGDNAVIIMTF